MESDRFSVRAVVITLGAVVLFVVCGMIFLASTQTPIPDSLDRIGFAALGAVAGILAKTSIGAQDVQVVNEAEDAVPVEEAPKM